MRSINDEYEIKRVIIKLIEDIELNKKYNNFMIKVKQNLQHVMFVERHF
jgi:macrodomain Ter protein organizer (MatP/YcbG family)